MLKFFILLSTFISSVFTSAMALTTDEIAKNTSGKGVFNVTITNNNKRSQNITISTLAFLKNEKTPFSTSERIHLAPETTKTIKVQRTFCSPGVTLSESSVITASTPRDAILEARIKLFITDSTRRTTQVKQLMGIQLKYVDDTFFIDFPDYTFIIE